jgi:hypothetical protein
MAPLFLQLAASGLFTPPTMHASYAQALSSPDIISRSRIGQGAQADVFLGESLAGGKQIVIKLGLKRGAIDREVTARFELARGRLVVAFVAMLT